MERIPTDPLGFWNDTRAHAWENVEKIEHLLVEARDKLVSAMRAMEEEMAVAVARGDAAGVAMMAWEYGPVAALVTDIEVAHAQGLPAAEASS